MATNLPWVENWEKSYRLTIGTREVNKLNFDTSDLNIVPESIRRPIKESDYTKVPSNAVVMSNLISDGNDRRGFHFSLDTTQQLAHDSASKEVSTLTLYNVNEELEKILDLEGCLVIVELGYGQQVLPAYSGVIEDVEVTDNGADRTFSIRMTSGGDDFKNTGATLYYDETVSEADIIKDMATRFPSTALGTYGLDDLTGRYKSGGRGFTGKLVTNFDNIMARNNLSYVHMNGKLVITPYRLLGANFDAFMRTNYNIPLESIKSINIAKSKDRKRSDPITEIDLSCMYVPVEVGQFVTIPDSKYTDKYVGTYQVTGRRIVASSLPSSGWDSVLRCKKV